MCSFYIVNPPDLSIVTIQCQNDATLICSLSLKIAFVHILMDERKREKNDKFNCPTFCGHIGVLLHSCTSFKVKHETKENDQNIQS